MVRGLTMKNITADMPVFDLSPALNTFKNKCPNNKRIQNLKVPKVVGGRINMILGIAYQAIYPTPLHTLQNGLTLFESKLRATSPGMLACIGGPIDCLNQICGYNGAESTFSYMCNLITNKKDRNFRMEYFPDLQMPQADKNIPGIQELELFYKYTEAPVHESFDLDNNEDPSLVKFCDQNNTALSSGDDDGLLNDMVTVKCVSCNTGQSEVENCIKVQDCSQGPVSERISTSQEHEQELIQKSNHIDETKDKAVVSLASTEEPPIRPSKDPKVVNDN